MKLVAIKLVILATIANFFFSSCSRDKISPQTTVEFNLDNNKIKVSGGWPEYSTTFAGAYSYRYYPTVYNKVWMHEIIATEGPNTWLWIRKNTENLTIGTTYTINPGSENDLVTVNYRGVGYVTSEKGTTFSFTISKVAGDLIDGTFTGRLKGDNDLFADVTAGKFTNVKIYDK